MSYLKIELMRNVNPNKTVKPRVPAIDNTTALRYVPEVVASSMLKAAPRSLKLKKVIPKTFNCEIVINVIANV